MEIINPPGPLTMCSINACGWCFSGLPAFWAGSVKCVGFSFSSFLFFFLPLGTNRRKALGSNNLTRSFHCTPSRKGWIPSLWWKSVKTNQMRRAKAISSELAVARVSQHHLRLAEMRRQVEWWGRFPWRKGTAQGCPAEGGCQHRGDRHPCDHFGVHTYLAFSDWS